METIQIQSPIGIIEIRGSNAGIVGITVIQKRNRAGGGATPKPKSRVMQRAVKELEEYFSGKRNTFTTPLTFERGTPFQKTVWQALTKIPYGTTATYAEIAQKVKKPLAVRAVGTAIGANPLMIIVPCHRVIRGDGSLGGFAAGLDCKVTLHSIEGISVD